AGTGPEPAPDISSPCWTTLRVARRFADRSVRTDSEESAPCATGPGVARPAHPAARPSDGLRAHCPRTVTLRATAAHLPHPNPADWLGVVPAARAPSPDCWRRCRGRAAGYESLPDRSPATSANRPPEPDPERRISL